MSVAAPARAPARPRRRAEAPAPVAVPRRARRVRPRRLTMGGAAWVIVLAALLGGIVALNVAALRDSIEVSRLQAQARQLASQNQLQQNRVTSLSSPVAIGLAASKLGMHLGRPEHDALCEHAGPPPPPGSAPMRRMSDHRLRLMLVMSLLAFVVVVGRAVQIQGVDAASLTRMAATQQRGETTLVGLRGAIIELRRPGAGPDAAVHDDRVRSQGAAQRARHGGRDRAGDGLSPRTCCAPATSTTRTGTGSCAPTRPGSPS